MFLRNVQNSDIIIFVELFKVCNCWRTKLLHSYFYFYFLTCVYRVSVFILRCCCQVAAAPHIYLYFINLNQCFQTNSINQERTTAYTYGVGYVTFIFSSFNIHCFSVGIFFFKEIVLHDFENGGTVKALLNFTSFYLSPAVCE